MTPLEHKLKLSERDVRGTSSLGYCDGKDIYKLVPFLDNPVMLKYSIPLRIVNERAMFISGLEYKTVELLGYDVVCKTVKDVKRLLLVLNIGDSWVADLEYIEGYLI